jgi:hypothetical protein
VDLLAISALWDDVGRVCSNQSDEEMVVHRYNMKVVEIKKELLLVRNKWVFSEETDISANMEQNCSFDYHSQIPGSVDVDDHLMSDEYTVMAVRAAKVTCIVFVTVILEISSSHNLATKVKINRIEIDYFDESVLNNIDKCSQCRGRNFPNSDQSRRF